MFFTTEDVTKEDEIADFVWNKSDSVDNARLDVSPQVKLCQLETVVPILADEFQCHRHAPPKGDLARLELEG